MTLIRAEHLTKTYRAGEVDVLAVKGIDFAIELMKKMRDELGTTFVFSTHDPKIMSEAEVIFTLEDGRLHQPSEKAVVAHA